MKSLKRVVMGIVYLLDSCWCMGLYGIFNECIKNIIFLGGLNLLLNKEYLGRVLKIDSP